MVELGFIGCKPVALRAQFGLEPAELGFGQQSLDYGSLWFSSQFDNATEQIDNSISNGENINESSGVYMNINAGLLWYAVFDDNQSLYFGGSLNHVNAPKVSFIDGDGQESIDTKWVIHAGGEIPFSHQLSVLPAVAVIGQGKNLVSLYGANVRYTNRDWQEVAIRAGLWGHLVKDFDGGLATPAVTFTAILEMERLNVGVSYDVATNQLSPPTNNRGAFELSLIYYHPASRREKLSVIEIGPDLRMNTSSESIEKYLVVNNCCHRTRLLVREIWFFSRE